MTREPSPVHSDASSETQSKLDLLLREVNTPEFSYEQKRAILEEVADRLGVMGVRGANWQLQSIAGAICKFKRDEIISRLSDSIEVILGATAFGVPNASKDDRLLEELERTRKLNVEILCSTGDKDLVRGCGALPPFTWPRTHHNVTRGLQSVAMTAQELTKSNFSLGELRSRLIATGKHLTIDEHMTMILAWKVLNKVDCSADALALISEVTLLASGEISPETVSALRLARVAQCVSSKEFSEWIGGDSIPGLPIPTRNVPRTTNRQPTKPLADKATRLCRLCNKSVPPNISFAEHQSSKFCSASGTHAVSPKNGSSAPPRRE